MYASPGAVQDAVLKGLLAKGGQTEYGKQYCLDQVAGPSDLGKALPLQDYEDVKPYIYRMMDGARDVLWPGEVLWYSKSSGTTSERSKYLPVTDDVLYRNNVASSWDTMALTYHDDPESQIFWKKSLVMGGSLERWKHNPKVTVGDVSAILLHRMPAVGRPFYTPDFSTALLDDWEDKIDKMVEICTEHDVVMFGGVPTWTIVLFNKILEQTGASNILEVWPNARYYLHGGVGFEPYRETFKSFLPSDDFVYREVYNASEGYFAIQDRAREKGMLLLLDNDIYYEFISMEELTKDDPQAIPITEVEVDRHYAIVISTSAGLWRYMPGDTVCFTSVDPYRIRVSGRTKHFINVFGEEVMVGDTEKALADTVAVLPAKVSDYTVAPVFMSDHSKGGHQWLIEFEVAPDNLEAFEILLDDNLRKTNSDYAAKRHKDIALDRLKIEAVPKGTFHRWLASKGKVGGQHKVPRLYNTRKYLDELRLYR